MNRTLQMLTLALLVGLPIARACAQSAATPADARPEVAAPQRPPGPDAVPPKAAKAAKSTAQSEAGEPRAATSPAKSPKPADRVELDTTTVTGNRELPKVMYVVPWKKSDIGDLGGKPMNSLLDEVLAPVDRDVFRREVVYYQAVRKSDVPQGAAADAAPPKQGEK